MSIMPCNVNALRQAIAFVALAFAIVANAVADESSQKRYGEDDFQYLGIYSGPDGHIEIIAVGRHIVALFTDAQGNITKDTGTCANGGSRGKYFEGTTTDRMFGFPVSWPTKYGLNYKGTIWLCTRSAELLKQCSGLEDAWATPMELEFHRRRITIRYQQQIYEKDDNGKYDCTPKVEEHTLTVSISWRTEWESFKDVLSDEWERTKKLPGKIKRKIGDATDTLHDKIDPNRKLDDGTWVDALGDAARRSSEQGN